jgi:hypothetical protein
MGGESQFLASESALGPPADEIVIAPAMLASKLAQLFDSLGRRSWTVSRQQILELIAATQEMFPGVLDAELMRDPEEDANGFIVLTVNWTTDLSQLIETRLKWHEKISQLFPGSFGLLRLSIVPD